MQTRDILSRLYRLIHAKHTRRRKTLSLEPLEERATPTAAINLIANSYSVPAGAAGRLDATELVPLSLLGPNPSSPVTYTASSTNAQVTTQIVTTTQTLDLTVSGSDSNGAPFSGDIKLALFANESPLAVGRIVALTNAGFYNGLTFHRIINGFMAQGGDPSGNGTGGSTLGTFGDEFSTDLTFNSPGLFAFANSGSDTSNSQFFITDIGLPLASEPQGLNFRYDIFGQMVSGFDTYKKLITTPVGMNSSGETSKPLTTPIINKAQILNDPTTAVLRITGANGFQDNATINITANDGSGVSNAAIGVSYVPATVNNPPFLGPLGNHTTEVNTPITFPLTATDFESDQVTFSASDSTNTSILPQNVTLSYDAPTGLLTLTPNNNFTGTVGIIFGVRDQTARNNKSLNDPSNYDHQKITLTVLPTVSGTGQSATVSTVFTNTLTVTVDDANGNPVSGATVTFASPASGAGATFTGGNTAITNAQGQASKTITANATGGTYTVAAAAAGVSYSFNLTNVPDPNQPPVINTITPQAVNDGSALSFTITATAPIINGSPAPVAFSLGSGAPAGASINAQTGLFTWTPSQFNGQAPGVYNVPVVVTETSAPNLSGSATFSVTVGNSSTNQGTGADAQTNLNKRTLVAQGVDNSAEYYTNIITLDYQKYVKRAPTQAELTGYWLLNVPIPGTSGGANFTDEQIESLFIGSPEYIANHGGAGQGWIVGMYNDLLGRTPAQSEVDFWLGRLAAQVSTIDIAYGFAASKERESTRVTGDYGQFLGRSAASSEIDYWVNFFLSGGTNEKVIAGFVASQEYFQGHGNNIVDWLFADYKATLNRIPDLNGFNFWEAQL